MGGILLPGKLLLSCLLFVMISGRSSVDSGETSSYFVAPALKVVSRSRRQAPSEVPKITDMFIKSRVSSRFATVTVSSQVVNSENKDLEATFSVQIPETAFIANFTMVINDTFYVGTVDEKKKAQLKYDKAKQQGQSAGQVKHQKRDVARGMDVFNVNVNVAAMSDVHFELTYQELLERRLGLYKQRIMVQPLQVVENLTLDLFYSEPQQFVRFSYREPGSSEIMKTSSDYSILTASPSTRNIVYKPPVSEQREMNNETGIDGEFVVTYDVGHAFDGGNIVFAEENNYFIHYFSIDKSQDVSAMPKNIMFVIDISGSMGGRKIEQTREAMKTILPQLNEADVFNIMIFDDRQEVWQTSPISATQKHISLAKEFVDERVHASGGTNINIALVESVAKVAFDEELQGKAGIIVFLTDGQPTSGETNTRTIRQNVKRLNEDRVGVFTLGFGNNVDFEFLQQISIENGGFARRIYEESDAASQLVTFYQEVKDPLLKDVKIRYQSNQVIESDLTRTVYKLMFSGIETVIAGRRLGNKLDAEVYGSTATNTINLVVPDTSKTQLVGPTGQYTEKLWAYLTIKDLLRKKAIAGSPDEAAALEARALNMSLHYNFVTPLTSLVVVQEAEEYNDVHDEFAVRKSGSPGKTYGKMQNAFNTNSSAGHSKIWLCGLVAILEMIRFTMSIVIV